MKTNININTNINRQGYDKAYQNSWAGRLRTAKQYQERSIAPLTAKDNLTVADLEMLEKMSNGKCPCCGEKFNSQSEMQISHWVAKGNLNAGNIFLSCADCNSMQRQIQINFLVFKKITNMTFLKYFQKNPDLLIEQLNLNEKDVKRICNRIEKLNSNR